MRRVAVGRDCADRMPPTELFGQLTARQVTAECAEVGLCVRLENEYSHGVASLSRKIMMLACSLCHELRKNIIAMNIIRNI